MPVQAPCGGSACARTGGCPRSIRGDLALASARDAPSGRSRPRRCRLQPAWPPGSRGLAPSSVHVQGQRERQAACGLAPRASRHRFSCGSRAWDPRGRTEPTRGGLSRSGDCKLPSHTPRSGSETRRRAEARFTCAARSEISENAAVGTSPPSALARDRSGPRRGCRFFVSPPPPPPPPHPSPGTPRRARPAPGLGRTCPRGRGQEVVKAPSLLLCSVSSIFSRQKQRCFLYLSV